MSAEVRDSVMDISMRAKRFEKEQSDEPDRGEPDLVTEELEIGAEIPMCRGLRVQFPGYFLKPRPLCKEFPLHPWKGILTGHRQDKIIIRNEATQKIMHLVDWHRIKKKTKYTRKELSAYDREQDSPLCKMVDTNRCVLVVDSKSSGMGVFWLDYIHSSHQAQARCLRRSSRFITGGWLLYQNWIRPKHSWRIRCGL